MIEEVYDYLREYGFTKKEVNKFEEENEKMFFTNLKEVQKNINFLLNKGLIKEEIMNIFRYNPFMITVKDNRLEALDKIYLEDLKLGNNIKQLILNNPDTYIASPIELQKIIDYLKEHNKTNEKIANFILNNPQVVSMNFDSFKN